MDLESRPGHRAPRAAGVHSIQRRRNRMTVGVKTFSEFSKRVQIAPILSGRTSASSLSLSFIRKNIKTSCIFHCALSVLKGYTWLSHANRKSIQRFPFYRWRTAVQQTTVLSFNDVPSARFCRRRLRLPLRRGLRLSRSSDESWRPRRRTIRDDTISPFWGCQMFLQWFVTRNQHMRLLLKACL